MSDEQMPPPSQKKGMIGLSVANVLLSVVASVAAVLGLSYLKDQQKAPEPALPMPKLPTLPSPYQPPTTEMPKEPQPAQPAASKPEYVSIGSFSDEALLYGLAEEKYLASAKTEGASRRFLIPIYGDIYDFLLPAPMMKEFFASFPNLRTYDQSSPQFSIQLEDPKNRYQVTVRGSGFAKERAIDCPGASDIFLRQAAAILKDDLERVTKEEQIYFGTVDAALATATGLQDADVCAVRDLMREVHVVDLADHKDSVSAKSRAFVLDPMKASPHGWYEMIQDASLVGAVVLYNAGLYDTGTWSVITVTQLPTVHLNQNYPGFSYPNHEPAKVMSDLLNSIAASVRLQVCSNEYAGC